MTQEPGAQEVSTAQEQHCPERGLELLIVPVPAVWVPLPANQFCINELYVPRFAR